jgi:hypothetical protein
MIPMVQGTRIFFLFEEESSLINLGHLMEKVQAEMTIPVV